MIIEKYFFYSVH